MFYVKAFSSDTECDCKKGVKKYNLSVFPNINIF